MSLTPLEFARALTQGATGPSTGISTPSIRPQHDLTKVKTTNRIPEGTSPSGTPFWGEDPESWDSVVIKGQRLPGICAVKGKGFSQRLDRKKSAGKNGHSVTHLGVDCAKIEITITMWTEEHLRAWEKLIPLLKPRAKTQRTVDRYKLSGAGTVGLQDQTTTVFNQSGTSDAGDRSGFQSLTKSLAEKQKRVVSEGGPEPVPIYHPALSLYKIGAVIILSATFPEDQGKGVFTVKLDCEEFVTGANRKGSVSTKRKAPDLTTLGPGAITRKLQATTPATDNTQP